MRRRGVSLRSVTHMIVRGSHAETSSDTDRPTPAHLAHWRDKIRPARAAQGRFRYKTLPARPTSPHVRYKTLPARPKWPNLAQSTHAGRVLYRSHHQEAKQGEFLHRTRGRDGASQHNRTPGPTCVEGAGGTGVEGTGGTSVEGTGGTGGHGRASRHRAWPRCQWITGPGRSSHKQQQHPAQANFACNSPTTRIDTRSKTAEYQRLDFNT